MNTSLEITLFERTFKVEALTIGHIMGIEARKSELSRGQYGQISSSRLLVQSVALDLIDSLASVLTLFPAFSKDLQVDNVLDIPADKCSELLKVYQKEMAPWYFGWIKILSGIEDKEDKQEGKQ